MSLGDLLERAIRMPAPDDLVRDAPVPPLLEAVIRAKIGGHAFSDPTEGDTDDSDED